MFAQYVLEQEPVLLVVDLFSGAGGLTSGVEDSFLGKRKMAKVIAAINHDPFSIKSHSANHKDVLHFTEDVRTLDLTLLIAHVAKYRLLYPKAKLVLAAGLECTNFSKAKGGQSRDADSRTLAEHLFRYIEALNPDYVFIENVAEFLTYGPLRIKSVSENARMCKLSVEKNKSGKIAYSYIPVKKLKGCWYKPWKEHIMSYGYNYDHVILNCADYGLRTIRKRLFIQFSKDTPITWPEQTHSKDGAGGYKKWKPVRPLLDLDDTGESMFHPSRKFKSGKSYLRVLKGCLRFVVNADSKDSKQFIVKYMSNAKNGGVGSSVVSIDSPCHAVTGQQRMNIASAQFLTKRYSSNNNKSVNKGSSIDEPCHTIPARQVTELVSPDFLIQYYTNGGDLQDIKNPAPAVVGKDQMHKVHTQFLVDYYGKPIPRSLDSCGKTVLPNPKEYLTTAWMYDEQFGNGGYSIDKPSVTVVASQHKKPLKIATAVYGEGLLRYPITDEDSVEKVALKLFMLDAGIYDIMIRSLNVRELLRIQDFKPDYILYGPENHKKKMIGNAVPRGIVTKIIWCMVKEIMKSREEDLYLLQAI